MRIIFAGTPQAAVPTLEALINSTHEIVAVLTRPPARVGRGRKVAPSPVAVCAQEHQLPIIEASSMRDPEVQQHINDLHADLGVVVAYGAIIPENVLNMPQRGWINLHFSDLPRWRGAAPVQHAILAGDTTTASCVFQLEKGLDTGPVFSRIPFTIEHETSDELLQRMSHVGAEQVRTLLDDMETGNTQATPQENGENDENVTYAPMLHPTQGFISFDATTAHTDQHIRAYTTNPGAWTTLPGGTRMKLATATPATSDLLTRYNLPETAPSGTLAIKKNTVLIACLDGWLQLGKVAPAGKGWMDAGAWARGARLDEGARLGRSLTQGEHN